MRSSSIYCLAVLILAGCSTPRRPATVTPITAPATSSAPLPIGAAPRGMLTARAFDQPATVTAPSLATIAFLPGYINLQWQPCSDPSVTHYAIYWGSASRYYKNQIICATTNGSVRDLTVGETDYFAVTALDNFGDESDFSDELAVVIPQYLALTFDAGSQLESSTDLVNWMPRAATFRTNTFFIEQDTSKPAEFFRAVTNSP